MESNKRTKLVEIGGYKSPPEKINGIIRLCVINSLLQVPRKTRTEQGWGKLEIRYDNMKLNRITRRNRDNLTE